MYIVHIVHPIPDWATYYLWLSYNPIKTELHVLVYPIPDWAAYYLWLSYNPIKTELHVHPIPDWATYYIWLSYNPIKTDLHVQLYNVHPILHAVLFQIELQPNKNWATCTSHSWLGYILSLTELQLNQNWAASHPDWAKTQSKLSCNPIKNELQSNQNWAKSHLILKKLHFCQFLICWT